MRIGLVADVHSNLVALEAVLADLGMVDALWHLGDIVGYGPEPDAVVDRLAGLGATGVRGNHDAVAAGDAGAEWFNEDARAAIEWTREVIGPRTHAWLAALPERRVEGDFTLVHGSPRDPIWEYVTSRPVAAASFPAFSTDHCLHGHTHIPAVWREVDGAAPPASPHHGATVALDAGRTLLNPGSVGQPRDGDPRASYAVIDTEARTMTFRRVGYDIAATQAAMRRHRLPERLVLRLDHGY